MLMLFLLQAAAAQPDIQLGVRLTADKVRVEQRGVARLETRASLDGGSSVSSSATPAGGSRELRNVVVEVDAAARIGPTAETPGASPR